MPRVVETTRPLARDRHAMAHVRRVVSVAGEAAPELVELVDRFERLAFHDHWWKQSSRCLPLHQFDGFVSELAPSGSRALSQAAPASSVHRQCVFSRKRPFAFGAAVWEVKGLNLHFRRSRVTITQSSQQP